MLHSGSGNVGSQITRSDKRIGVLEVPSSIESMANLLHPIVSRKSRETYNYDKVTEFCGASGDRSIARGGTPRSIAPEQASGSLSERVKRGTDAAINDQGNRVGGPTESIVGTPRIVNEGNDVEKPKGELAPVDRFVRHFGLPENSANRGDIVATRNTLDVVIVVETVGIGRLYCGNHLG